jgi:hypothetical protein
MNTNELMSGVLVGNLEMLNLTFALPRANPRYFRVIADYGP